MRLLRGTDWVFKYTFCPHSVFMCFVWMSEQTAIISLYSINWLVFITETGCVYCAVWLDVYMLLYSDTLPFHHYKAQWLLYVPPGLTFSNSTFWPHSVFMCFVSISEQTAIISLYSINWLVFITETECVYCAVRTGSTSTTQVTCPLQRINKNNIRSSWSYGIIRQFMALSELRLFWISKYDSKSKSPTNITRSSVISKFTKTQVTV
jgi:hypothetical protein